MHIIISMEKSFFLNRDQYTKGDTETAFNRVIDFLKNNKDITVITFLVYQTSNITDFLSELGFSSQQIKDRGFETGRYKVQIRTIKTYQPNYISGAPKEILISIGIPPKNFDQFVNCGNIKYWVLVPWLLDENLSWLYLHEAEDIETGNKLIKDFELDSRIINAIEWLKDTSFPNEGMNHPNDSDRLKSVANEIKRKKIKFSTDAIIYYCIKNGILETSARKIAEHFKKAQSHTFKASNCYTISD